MKWARVRRLLAPPAPRRAPWSLSWRSRASLAYAVPFTDYSARLRFVSAELAPALEAALSLRTDSEIEEYLESLALPIGVHMEPGDARAVAAAVAGFFAR